MASLAALSNHSDNARNRTVVIFLGRRDAREESTATDDVQHLFDIATRMLERHEWARQA